MLTEALVKSLKIDGFKKKGLNLRLFHGDIKFIINFQKSQFNDLEESFAINLAIFSDKVYELCWGKKAPVLPSESDGIFRKRAGDFVNVETCSNWYSLKSEKDVPMVLDKIITCFNSGIIESAKKINTLFELHKFLSVNELPKQDYLYLIQFACLLSLIDKQKEALVVLELVSINSDTWKRNADLVKSRIVK